MQVSMPKNSGAKKGKELGQKRATAQFDHFNL
jgi:hypothetical protein